MRCQMRISRGTLKLAAALTSPRSQDWIWKWDWAVALPFGAEEPQGVAMSYLFHHRTPSVFGDIFSSQNRKRPFFNESIFLSR